MIAVQSLVYPITRSLNNTMASQLNDLDTDSLLLMYLAGELTNGAKFVLVIFTTDHANEREIIPSLGRIILGGMSADKETAR